MIYPQEFKFDWKTCKYSDKDIDLIGLGATRICKLAYEMLAPLVDAGQVFKGLVIEFTDYRTPELLKYGAIGLAYRNRNINYVPAGLSMQMFTAYSGVIAMEMAHSLIERLTGDLRMGNDLVHWLYNEQKLQIHQYRSQWNLKRHGGAVELIIPDLAYGWQNRKEIMDSIRSGKSKEGLHKYWSDPAWKGDVGAPVAATQHELEHLQHFLARCRRH